MAVQIQDYLIAVVQNIQLLIAHRWPKPRAALTIDVGGYSCVPWVIAVASPADLNQVLQDINHRSP